MADETFHGPNEHKHDREAASDEAATGQAAGGQEPSAAGDDASTEASGEVSTPRGEGEVRDGGSIEDVGEASGADEPFNLDALDFEPELPDPLVEMQRERDSYLEALQRLQADFENYKKRVARQQSDLSATASRGLVTKLLPALDTLTLALAHATSETGSDEVASILSQISSAFLEVLAKEGLEIIEPTGKRFDPEEAEAVAHDEGDGEPVVAEVFRVGYRWHGQTLRPAMVRVTGS